MRLGAKLMAVGIVLTIIGLPMAPVHEEQYTSCSGSYYGGCETVTEVTPNYIRAGLLLLGGVLFGAGAGGYVGSVDSDVRREREMEKIVEELELLHERTR